MKLEIGIQNPVYTEIKPIGDNTFNHTKTMYSPRCHTIYFRQPSEKDIEISRITFEDEAEEKEPGKENYILCRRCRRMITSLFERIEMNGAHLHSFANPHGLVFEIGCFRFAAGCGYAGPVTDDFSWFAGYDWRIALCRHCLNHAGWLFTSPDKNSFNGLILDRLVFPES